MSEEAQDLVRKMKKIGIKNSQICEFIQIEKGISITPLDVSSITANLNPAFTQTQTFDLAQYMEELHGSYDLFTLSKEEHNVIIDMFTQTPEEEKNLLEFGDVIFLDGTKFNNSLNWEMFPITLIDYNRELVLGGVFFLGLQTTEIFEWVLKIINKYSDSKFTTIFTDEDSALMVAIPKFYESVRPITHYICTLHKFNNIKKHIYQQDIPNKVKQQLVEYAFQLCYDKNPVTVEAAFTKMMEIAPSLTLYLLNFQKNLHKFSYSAKGTDLTLGYNTTAPAESCNKMLKSYFPEKTLTLKETRELICRAILFKNKFMPIEQYRFNSDQLNLMRMIGL